MNRSRKKLSVNRQTLRALGQRDLEDAGGGWYVYWQKSVAGKQCDVSTDPNPTGCVFTCNVGGCFQAP